MNIMISQPIGERTLAEITETITRTTSLLNERGFTVLDTFFNFNHRELESEGYCQIPLYYLAKSLETMSKCDAVYFCKGWQINRGCVIEHDAAHRYGLTLYYED